MSVNDDVLGPISILGTLAPGESSTVGKTVSVGPNSAPRNVGTAKGTDPLGWEVKATDDAVITLVLGEVLTAPRAELPRTGSGSRNPLTAGIGLLLAGMVIVVAAHTRRRTA